jgi:hypothetical protein
VIGGGTEFSAVIDRIEPRFARYEPLRHAGELMLGMVSGLDRKNCWTIAEHRDDATADGLQHLLSRAKWDAEAVRDDLRDYVVDAFGDPGALAYLRAYSPDPAPLRTPGGRGRPTLAHRGILPSRQRTGRP